MDAPTIGSDVDRHALKSDEDRGSKNRVVGNSCTLLVTKQIFTTAQAHSKPAISTTGGSSAPGESLPVLPNVRDGRTQTDPAINMRGTVSDIRRDVMDMSTVVSDIYRNVLKSQEGADDQHRSVSAIHTRSTTG